MQSAENYLTENFLFSAFPENDAALAGHTDKEDEKANSTETWEASEQSDQGDLDILNMDGLTPGFTSQAYIRHIIEHIQALAIQGRYDEALEAGHIDAVSKPLMSNKLSAELESLLEDTRKMAEKHELTTEKQDQKFMEPVSASGPALDQQGPALSAGFHMACRPANEIYMPSTPDSALHREDSPEHEHDINPPTPQGPSGPTLRPAWT